MNTTDIKTRIHEELESSDDRLLKMIYALIKEYKDEGVTGGISVEQYNKEIDEAMKRMDEGHFVTQEDLEKEAEQW